MATIPPGVNVRMVCKHGVHPPVSCQVCFPPSASPLQNAVAAMRQFGRAAVSLDSVVLTVATEKSRGRGVFRSAAIQEAIQSGAAQCIRTVSIEERPGGLFVVEAPESALRILKWVDAESETWIESIGRHKTNRDLLAACDGRFYGNPDYECLYLR